MIRVVHATGNVFVRALLQGLERAGARYEFWTTIALQPGGMHSRLPGRQGDQLSRREFPVPPDKVRTRPMREWVRLLSAITGPTILTQHEKGWASVDAVYCDLDRALARELRSWGRCRQDEGSSSWVYGYEDGVLESFLETQKRGWRRAYELPIAYWRTSRRLLEEESVRWPEWAPTLVGPADSDAKLERKTRELELAEVIIVPSRFVASSLDGFLRPDQQVVVAEFGSPEVGASKNGHERRQPKEPHAAAREPLKVLFAGSMSQRKGLADVFAAMKILGREDVELVIMGSPLQPLDFYHRQGVPFSYEPPRPHHKVLELMRSCDVLLLPSIVEGRALVQQEALAMGLPIVVTANAGGEDLVTEGETGFLVPIRSPEVIANRLDWLASHRAELEAMRPACQAKAATYTWERYAQAILTALQLV